MTVATVTDQPTGQRLAALDAMLTRVGLELHTDRDAVVRALVLTFQRHPPGRSTPPWSARP